MWNQLVNEKEVLVEGKKQKKFKRENELGLSVAVEMLNTQLNSM